MSLEAFKHFRSFLADKKGNFGIITALLAPVILGTAGIAVDITRAMELKTLLQQEADAATLSAAMLLSRKNFDLKSAEDLANVRYATRAASIDTGCSGTLGIEDYKKTSMTAIDQQANGNKGKKFKITFAATFQMCVNPLTALVTGPTIGLHVGSTSVSATASRDAFSMHLVLDRSGSMDEIACEKRNASNTCLQAGTIKKMEALKTSVDQLLNVVGEADPNKVYARFAVVEFAGSKGKSVPFEWGSVKTRAFVKSLTASGGTNSTGAVQHAYDLLRTTAEDTEHEAKGNDTPTKYILFMTDGDNNDSNSDTLTLNACTLAKQKGIVVYTVAFDVKQGRATNLLSKCATSSGHYYAAKTASELYAAFKEIGQRANSGVARITN